MLLRRKCDRDLIFSNVLCSLFAVTRCNGGKTFRIWDLIWCHYHKQRAHKDCNCSLAFGCTFCSLWHYTVLTRTNESEIAVYSCEFLTLGLVSRGVAWFFRLGTHRKHKENERRRRETLAGSGGMLPQKLFMFRASEMPFPMFSGGIFINRNMKNC